MKQRIAIRRKGRPPSTLQASRPVRRDVELARKLYDEAARSELDSDPRVVSRIWFLSESESSVLPEGT